MPPLRLLHDTDICTVIAEREEQIKTLKDGLVYERFIQVRFYELSARFPRMLNYEVSAELWAIIVTKKKEMRKWFDIPDEHVPEIKSQATKMLMEEVLNADKEALEREVSLHKADLIGSIPDQPTVQKATCGGEDAAALRGRSLSKDSGNSIIPPIVQCFHCGRTGHFKERCHDLYPELREAYYKKKKAAWCGYCGKDGHWRKFCHDLHPELRPKTRRGTRGG